MPGLATFTAWSPTRRLLGLVVGFQIGMRLGWVIRLGRMPGPAEALRLDSLAGLKPENLNVVPSPINTSAITENRDRHCHSGLSRSDSQPQSEPERRPGTRKMGLTSLLTRIAAAFRAGDGQGLRVGRFPSRILRRRIQVRLSRIRRRRALFK